MADRQKERIEAEYIVWLYDMKRKYNITRTEVSKIVTDYENNFRNEINKWRRDEGGKQKKI